MLNRSLHSPANDVEETLDATLARWSRDPSLSDVMSARGLLLVLSDDAGLILHASDSASGLRSGIADADGRVFASVGLRDQIARLGDFHGSPRLVRLRFDGRGLATPSTCRIARALLGDGRKALLVSPLAMPRVRRPAPDRRIDAPPAAEPAGIAAAGFSEAGTTSARFLWRSDGDGVLTKIAASQADLVTGLEGRSWQALCAQAGTLEAECLLTALRTHSTFRSLPLHLILRPSGREVALELSGAPVGRGNTAVGFSGFGIVRNDPVVLSASGTPLPNALVATAPKMEDAPVEPGEPTLLAAHPGCHDLSTEETAAFLEIAQALGGAPSPHERDTGVAAPPARADSAVLAEALERFPAAILVRRGEALLFVNSRFLALGGFADLEALRDAIEAGAEPDGLDRASSGQIRLAHRDGSSVPLEVERSEMRWDGDAAEIVLARPASVAPIFESTSPAPDIPAAAAVEPVPQAEEAPGEDAQRAATAARRRLEVFAAAGRRVRAPLNGILSLTDAMLVEQFGPLGSEQYRDYLLDIRASGERSLGLLNDFVDLAEIEAGQIDLAFADLALNDLVGRCIAQLQPQAARERIVFRTSLAADLPALVADERSLRQAALNAVAHAIRFSEPGGQVIVSTSRAEPGGVALRVRDTGAGMTPSEVEQALEPFRLPMPGPDDDDASGLGLTLTKSLVEANRGSFRLSSRKGEGTLVEMVFPAAPSA